MLTEARPTSRRRSKAQANPLLVKELRRWLRRLHDDLHVTTM